MDEMDIMDTMDSVGYVFLVYFCKALKCQTKQMGKTMKMIRNLIITFFSTILITSCVNNLSSTIKITLIGLI